MSDDSNHDNIKSILNEVKQDLNSSDHVYRTITNISEKDHSIFKENDSYKNSNTPKNIQENQLEKNLEDLHTNIRNLE